MCDAYVITLGSLWTVDAAKRLCKDNHDRIESDLPSVDKVDLCGMIASKSCPLAKWQLETKMWFGAVVGLVMARLTVAMAQLIC